MPFKLFFRRKKSHKEIDLKTKSKSTLDLNASQADEPPDQPPDINKLLASKQKYVSMYQLPVENGKCEKPLEIGNLQKTKEKGSILKLNKEHGSILKLNKENGSNHHHVTLEEDQTVILRKKSATALSNQTNGGRTAPINIGRAKSFASVEQSGKGQYLHPLTSRHSYCHEGLGPVKSSSCSSFTDTMGGSKHHWSDIAQLDSYIDHLRRTPDGGCNMTNRLCCAQFLRMGLMRLEQNHFNGALRSKSHDKLHQINHSPPNHSSIRFQSRMNGVNRRPPCLRYQTDKDRTDSGSGSSSYDNSSNGRLMNGFGCENKENHGLHDTEDEHGQTYDSDSGSDNGFTSSTGDLPKRKSMSVFPTDIEIY